MGLTPIDWLIVGLYLTGVTVAGIVIARRQRTTVEYFLGGRTLPWWAVGCSIVASETSTLTFISVPGLAYRGDMHFLQLAFGYFAGRVLVSLLLIPAYYRGHLETAYEFLGNRFGYSLRATASSVFLVTRVLASGVRLFATAIPVHLITGLDYWICIGLVGMFTLLYTAVGGLKAVVAMDVAQLCIYLLGAGATMWFILHGLPDGWSSVVAASAASATNKFEVVNTSWGTSILSFLSTPYTLLGAVVPEPTYKPGRAAPPPIKGAIAFDHVNFRYRLDGQQVLYDVNLQIPAGQMLGIVGPSGSGKSTLTKLVQRLYVPEGGRVLIDGVDIALVDVAWLRRQVGVVLQENVLFNRTIRDNIALGDPSLPMERVAAAAQLAGAHDFILALPEGYDTMVGERRANLSGGQRQRIAIARALIGNPRILIFDEATSALDYESERVIQDNMRRIAQGRTVLIIAHRLSAVAVADRIITIERGRIVEDGNHAQLIERGGRYATLHRMQTGSVGG